MEGSAPPHDHPFALPQTGEYAHPIFGLDSTRPGYAHLGPNPPGQARQNVGADFSRPRLNPQIQPVLFQDQIGQPHTPSVVPDYRRQPSISSGYHSRNVFHDPLLHYPAPQLRMTAASDGGRGGGMPTSLGPPNITRSQFQRATSSLYEDPCESFEDSTLPFAPIQSHTNGTVPGLPTGVRHVAHRVYNSQEVDLTGVGSTGFDRNPTTMDIVSPSGMNADLDLQVPISSTDDTVRRLRLQGSPHAPPFQEAAQYSRNQAATTAFASQASLPFSPTYPVSMGPPSFAPNSNASIRTDPGASQKPLELASRPTNETRSCLGSDAVGWRTGQKRPLPTGMAGERNFSRLKLSKVLKLAKEKRACTRCYIDKGSCKFNDSSGVCDACQQHNPRVYCSESDFSKSNVFLQVLSEKESRTLKELQSSYAEYQPDRALLEHSKKDVRRVYALRILSDYKGYNAYNLLSSLEMARNHSIFHFLSQVTAIFQGRKALDFSSDYEFNSSDWNIVLAASVQRALNYLQKNLEKNNKPAKSDNERCQNLVVFLAVTLEAVLFFREWFGKTHLVKTDEKNASTIKMYWNISHNLANHLRHWADKAFPSKSRLSDRVEIRTPDEHSLDFTQEQIIIQKSFWDDLGKLYSCPNEGTAAQPAGYQESSLGTYSPSLPSTALTPASDATLETVSIANMARQPAAGAAPSLKKRQYNKPKRVIFNRDHDRMDATDFVKSRPTDEQQDFWLAKLLKRLRIPACHEGSSSPNIESSSSSGVGPLWPMNNSISPPPPSPPHTTISMKEAEEIYDNSEGPDWGAVVSVAFSFTSGNLGPRLDDVVMCHAASAAADVQDPQAGPSHPMRDRSDS